MKMRSTLALAFAASACAQTSAPAPHPAPPSHSGPASWSYVGETGPAQWGALDARYSVCSAGKAQSPIDLKAAQAEDGPALAIQYSDSSASISNNGHTVQVDFAPGGTLTLGPKTYDLLQFHFHSTSEHTVDGASFPLEVHFVHATAEGDLAVIGVMLNEGQENPAYKPVFDAVPAQPTEAPVPLASPLNADSLLPTSRTAYRYSGSLTTPPCSEAVAWHVLKDSVAVSAAQIAQFRAAYTGNNRPVMPLQGRAIQLR